MQSTQGHVLCEGQGEERFLLSIFRNHEALCDFRPLVLAMWTGGKAVHVELLFT